MNLICIRLGPASGHNMIGDNYIGGIIIMISMLRHAGLSLISMIMSTKYCESN